MTRSKFAIFVGGSKDGQRQPVQQWSTHLRVLIAERVQVPAGGWRGGMEVALKTHEEGYLMPQRPVNPRELPAGDLYYRGLPDADYGIYFFIGSNPVSR